MMILGEQLRRRDSQEAFNWFCTAAALGHTPAFTQVGLMYSNGFGGGRPDFAEAGGKDPSKIGEMLAATRGVVEKLLAGGA